MRVDPATGVIENLTLNKSYNVPPFPDIIREIISAGGMVEFARKRIRQQQRT